MKLNVFSLLILFPLFTSTAQAQVYGCGTIPSDPNKVWIYSGPTSAGSDQARYLPGSYKFKAEEKGSFTSSGHTAYWALFKAPTYASPASAFSKVEGTYTSSFGVLDRKSDRSLTAGSSGYYCAVVTSAHYNSCNNRCFIVQNVPTASGTAQSLPQGYTTVQAPVQFTGNGTIDLNAKQANLSYYWDFDNGQTSSNRNPLQSFDKAGTYMVTMKTFDGSYYSAPILVSSVWVRGPAQPPRNPSYHYSYCSHDGRTGDFGWERSGTSFELQVQQAGYWLDLYRGDSNSTNLTLQSYGPNTFRVRALDPDFGSASAWQYFDANIPACSGGGGVEPQ
jgi:hypothetical protein